MDNNENLIEVKDVNNDEIPDEETNGKRLDAAGMAELGLMIVGGITVAKKVVKAGVRTFVKLKAKAAEKKAAREEKKKAKILEVDPEKKNEKPEETPNNNN